MKVIVFFALSAGCLLLSGCQPGGGQAELEQLQARLDQARDRLEQAAAQTAAQAEAQTRRQLVHLVWFDMQPDADQEAFIAELRKLDEIPQVNGLEVGRFQDLGDARAMSHLELVMRMGFDSEEDYRTYQDHPIHQQLKQDIGPYLAGPPVTYDYWGTGAR